MANRVHNFCAGPCTLPLEVLREAQEEFVDYRGAGMSLVEMSHRGDLYGEVHQRATALAGEVFAAPEDFHVLFIQGGASLQFAMAPMNLLAAGGSGAYVNSGVWAAGAIQDGAHHGDIYTVWDGAGCGFTRMPEDEELQLRDGTRYLHLTSNETIGGIRFARWPQAAVPLVGDMSSDYMSRPVAWEKFDLVYGGVQKNLGPSGTALVFARKSVVDNPPQNIARYLRYDIHARSDSMFNTPPVFSIYMVGKVLQWIKNNGGVPAMEKMAARKSAKLYRVIDASGGYYSNPVDPGCRSHMNVIFRLPDEGREKLFLAEAEAAGLVNLKGHRSVGGCRASIYNAMPEAGVDALAQLMEDFQGRNGG